MDKPACMNSVEAFALGLGGAAAFWQRRDGCPGHLLVPSAARSAVGGSPITTALHTEN
jgi:hypothetical protein